MRTYNEDELTVIYLDYKGVSRKKIAELVALGNSIFDTISHLNKSAKNIIGDKKLEQFLNVELNEELKKLNEYLTKSEISVVTLIDDDFPVALREIPDPPAVLYYYGDLNLVDSTHIIGVVGTRKPTYYGKTTTEKFVRTLVGEAGFVTVSGLAYGIDSEVAKRTLEQKGKHIAVLGSGLKNLYPASNINLAEKIVDSGGLVITEYFPTVKPAQYTFPDRNRIISGLSHGVLVVEAGLNSGSLITATCAINQGKELFVVPADIDNANNMGSNQLIEELPETFTSSPNKILKAFGLGIHENAVNVSLSDNEKAVLNALSTGAKNTDELCEILGEDFKTLNLLLTEMEIGGIIRKSQGDYYSKV